jgi:hypothetical protein
VSTPAEANTGWLNGRVALDAQGLIKRQRWGDETAQSASQYLS